VEKWFYPGCALRSIPMFTLRALDPPWQESVCASLTELFARQAHTSRIEAFRQYYTWIKPEGLEYFQKRVGELRRDLEHALELTLENFTTRTSQDRALDILQFKLDILWNMLDTIDGHLEREGRE